MSIGSTTISSRPDPQYSHFCGNQLQGVNGGVFAGGNVANYCNYLHPNLDTMATTIARFKPGIAGSMTLTDGSSMNYGAIEERNGNILFYTGQGLREIFRPSTDEEKAAQPVLQKLVDDEAWDELKRSGHVDEVPLSSVLSVQ